MGLTQGCSMGLRWSTARGCAWAQCRTAHAQCVEPRWGVGAAERAAAGGTNLRVAGVTECVPGGGG